MPLAGRLQNATLELRKSVMALKEPQIMYAMSEPILAGKDVERRLNALSVILDLMSRGRITVSGEPH